jgi:hypothetical protein
MRTAPQSIQKKVVLLDRPAVRRGRMTLLLCRKTLKKKGEHHAATPYAKSNRSVAG